MKKHIVERVRKTTVAIVDDHAVVRMGLQFVLGMEKDLEFAGEKGDAEGIVSWLKKTDPDVLLLDIYMPGLDGLKALKEIRENLPKQKVIILTTSVADNDAYEAMRFGADGYLVKDRDAGDIAKAIRAVAAGGRYVPDSVQKLIDHRKETPNLSPRESEVLGLLSEGLSNSDIASRMNITLSGVKQHLKTIFLKLGVDDRVGAAMAAIRRGFVKQ